MKKIIRDILLSASALAFVAAPAMAQDPAASPAAGASQCNVEERDKLYNEKFYPNYSLTKGTPEQRKIAYEAGKEYLAKYSEPVCTDNAQIVTFIKNWIPKYESSLKQAEFDRLAKAFNDAVAARAAAKKAKNDAALMTAVGDIFRTGKELTAFSPGTDTMNAYLFMVDAGYDAALKKNNSYNAETIATAQRMISEINSGKAPAQWSPYKDKDEALAWQNYTIGYITYNGMSQKKEAMPYIYKAVQYNSGLKNWHFPYLLVAEMYLEEYTKAAKEYETNKASTDNELVNRLIGTYKAYADRAIEAYAKAYSIAKADTKIDKAVTDGIYATLTEFYKARKNGETTGLNEYVASVAAKQLTDPTTPITPVIEATPTTATTTPASTATITSKSSTTDSGAGREVTSGATAKSAATKTAAAKPAAKKPAPKKKS